MLPKPDEAPNADPVEDVPKADGCEGCPNAENAPVGFTDDCGRAEEKAPKAEEVAG